jgi:hypothetical protein
MGVVCAHLVWLGPNEAGSSADPGLMYSLAILVAVTVLEKPMAAPRLDVCVGDWRSRSNVTRSSLPKTDIPASGSELQTPPTNKTQAQVK